MSDDARAEYARRAALVRLRLEDLAAALERHEDAQRWREREFLVRVEAGLAELGAEVPAR